MQKLDQILTYTQVKHYVQKDLGDLSKEPKTTNTTSKFVVHHNGEDYVYSKNTTCKYCGTHYTAWKKPYVKGDRPLAVSFDGEVMEGCPKYT